MKDSIRINVAQDFSETPGPRLIKQGHFSGEKFFKSHLKPAFEKHEFVTVDLDGTEGFGPSFVDEAFRRLITELKLPLREIERRLTIISDEDELYKEYVKYALENAK